MGVTNDSNFENELSLSFDKEKNKVVYGKKKVS